MGRLVRIGRGIGCRYWRKRHDLSNAIFSWQELVGRDSGVNREQCKEKVWRDWQHSCCMRAAVKDGYCRQHHPDAVLARRKAADKKYDAQRRMRALAIRAPFFRQALQKIADGAEDSQQIALEALKGVK